MRTLNRASLAYLSRHPWQLGLALLGIVIGVAVIVAVDLANRSAAKAFERSMAELTGDATHQLIGGPGGIDAGVYTRLRVRDGFHALAPVVELAAEAAGGRATVLGVDPFAEHGFRTFTGTAVAGAEAWQRVLLDAGSGLLSAGLAERLGAGAGDSVELTVAGRPVSLKVASIIPADASRYSDLVVVDIATAQEWQGGEEGPANRLSRIDARLESPAAVARLTALLPPGVQLLPAASRAQAVTELSRAFRVNLTAMSLLALLIGVFLVYNSVSFAVLQRRQLLATLRALGLTRRQAMLLILREALALGIVGGLLGLLVGALLGNELLALVSRSINDLYFRVDVTSVRLDGVSLAKGLAAGLLATLVAAAAPALEATSYSARAGMTRIVIEQRARASLPYLVAGGFVLILLSIPVLQGESLVAGLGGLFLRVLGCALLLPPLVYVLARVLEPLAGRLGGTGGRHAIAGIAAQLSRTGVALVALAIAVSATVGVSVMVDSFRSAVSDWIETTLQADFYVSAGDAGLPPELIGEWRDLPGVAEVSHSRSVWIESPEGLTRLQAFDMAEQSYAGIDLLGEGSSTAWPAFDNDGAVLVSEGWSTRYGRGAGDVVRLPTDRGERAFRIAAVFRSYDANPAAVVMHRRFYDMFWNDRHIDAAGIYLDEAADPAKVVQELQALTELPLSIRANDELREFSLAIFDRTFIITNVLYWLALGVAVVGILGALLALELERARERATLRALGMTRVQLGVLVCQQSALLGLLAGLAALPLGLLMADLLIDVINRRAFGWSMTTLIRPEVLWQALALSTAAALLAGAWPAFRAARAAPAFAMREE